MPRIKRVKELAKLKQQKTTTFRTLDFCEAIERNKVQIESPTYYKGNEAGDRVRIEIELVNRNQKQDGYYCLLIPTFPDFGDRAIDDVLLSEMLAHSDETVRTFASLVQKLVQQEEVDLDEPPF